MEQCSSRICPAELRASRTTCPKWRKRWRSLTIWPSSASPLLASDLETLHTSSMTSTGWDPISDILFLLQLGVRAPSWWSYVFVSRSWRHIWTWIWGPALWFLWTRQWCCPLRTSWTSFHSWWWVSQPGVENRAEQFCSSNTFKHHKDTNSIWTGDVLFKVRWV